MPVRGKVLPQIRVLWLDANACRPQLSTELQGIGYALATAPENADGVMNVRLQHAETASGESARYSASIRDRQGALIRQTSGRGKSGSREALCRTISVEIAEYLEHRMLRIG